MQIALLMTDEVIANEESKTLCVNTIWAENAQVILSAGRLALVFGDAKEDVKDTILSVIQDDPRHKFLPITR